MGLTALFTFSAKSTIYDKTADQTHYVNGADFNIIFSALSSLQTELGTSAKGTYSSVAARLAYVENNLDVTDDFRVYSISSGTSYGFIGGTYELDGVRYSIESVSAGLNVATSVTTYVYLTSLTAIQTNTTGFPSNTSVLSLATIVSNSAGITSITDKRPNLTSASYHGSRHASGGSDSISSYIPGLMGRIYLSPEFPGAVPSADGGTGAITFTSDFLDSAGFTYYQGVYTGAVSLQTASIIVESIMPFWFRGFSVTASMLFNFATKSTDTGENSLSIEILQNKTSLGTFDCGVSTAADTWRTFGISSTAMGTWTAYDTLTIKFKFYSQNNNDVKLGRFYIDPAYT